MLYCREEKALFSNKKAGLSLRSYLHQRRVCLLLRGGQCRGAAHALPLRAAAESFLHQHRPHGRGVSLPLRHAAERLLALPSYRTARQRRRLSNESTVEHRTKALSDRRRRHPAARCRSSRVSPTDRGSACRLRTTRQRHCLYSHERQRKHTRQGSVFTTNGKGNARQTQHFTPRWPRGDRHPAGRVRSSLSHAGR